MAEEIGKRLRKVADGIDKEDKLEAIFIHGGQAFNWFMPKTLDWVMSLDAELEQHIQAVRAGREFKSVYDVNKSRRPEDQAPSKPPKKKKPK